jgi:hypothetical protein
MFIRVCWCLPSPCVTPVYTEVISLEEEAQLIHELNPSLKQKQYQGGHWDRAISGYRETERFRFARFPAPVRPMCSVQQRRLVAVATNEIGARRLSWTNYFRFVAPRGLSFFSAVLVCGDAGVVGPRKLCT